VRVSNPGMGVYNGSVSCGRVSSLFVYNSLGTRWVEIGWYEDPNDLYSCIPPTVSSGPPKVLAYRKFDTDEGCQQNPSTLSEGTDGFWVQDGNQDGKWNYYVKGTNVHTSQDLTPFVTGLLWNNGERLGTGNTAHADFDGMKRMDSSQTWKKWDSVIDYQSNDPGSHGCEYSATHQAIKLVGTAC
jgi:hypothetical protein